MSAPTNLHLEPENPPDLHPPSDAPIQPDHLARCNGDDPSLPVYVAIKGHVFDVTGKDAYLKNGPYHVFAGKDASRALATSSVKPEDVRPEWSDLGPEEHKVLDQWFTFFSKRYNIVGKVAGASNL